MSRRMSITVGISGGSGVVYAIRLLDILALHYQRVDVVLSNAARQVLMQEAGVEAPPPGPWALDNVPDANVTIWGLHDYNAPFASGSNAPREMVIVPCSMSTAASIAHGVDQNLLHHAAAVMIKESRMLIVVPRETPLSTIHLRNLLTLSEVGARIIPAMPGFYGGESTFDHLVNFVLQKIVNALGLDVRLCRRWGEPTESQ